VPIHDVPPDATAPQFECQCVRGVVFMILMTMAVTVVAMVLTINADSA
jgi:hypothetical protein